MKRLIASFISISMATGCATDVSILSTPEAMPGTYYSGNGLGHNVMVTLHGDGTYDSDLRGCEGLYGQAKGIWRLEGDQLIFDPINETGEHAGYLRQATTIRYKKRLGFVRHEDLERDKVSEQEAFLRKASGQ